ncbi:MAG: hypothetical protein SD837_09750 [Candidatus Electrothrix scaldis]|nr:MAG: hypothetical protein SD837_09750 [Candidatus Electrothrix sp. GW3-3]
MEKKYFEGREFIFLQDFSDGIEMNVISGLLKMNGIPHYVESPNVGQVSGYCSDPISRYLLFVELENVDLVKELIYQSFYDESDEAYNEYRWKLRKKQNRILAPLASFFFALLSFLMFYYSAVDIGLFMMGVSFSFLLILVCSERASYSRKIKSG